MTEDIRGSGAVILALPFAFDKRSTIDRASKFVQLAHLGLTSSSCLKYGRAGLGPLKFVDLELVVGRGWRRAELRRCRPWSDVSHALALSLEAGKLSRALRRLANRQARQRRSGRQPHRISDPRRGRSTDEAREEEEGSCAVDLLDERLARK